MGGITGTLSLQMFDAIASTFGAMKDRAVENSARGFINRKIENIGRVTRLTLDSRQKTISLEADLKGETSPIAVHIGSYEVRQREGATFVVVRRAEASREWIATALNQFLVGQELKVPDVLRKAL